MRYVTLNPEHNYDEDPKRYAVLDMYDGVGDYELTELFKQLDKQLTKYGLELVVGCSDSTENFLVRVAKKAKETIEKEVRMC